MNNAFFEVPIPINEPIKDYVNGSQEKEELLNTLNEMKNKIIDIPMIIDGKEITTDNKIKITAPHDHNLHIGNFYEGDIRWLDHHGFSLTGGPSATWLNYKEN